MLLQILTEFTLVPSNPCKSPIFLAFSLGLGVLAWRLWNFTIIPFLRPKEPLELPYWMPGMSKFDVNLKLIAKFEFVAGLGQLYLTTLHHSY